MTRVIGYVRVSTNEQATSGVSLAAQEAKIKAYCVAMDLELVEIIADPGFSASNLERPGLQKALEALRLNVAEGLIVTKLDRLTRSVRNLGELVDEYFGKTYQLFSIGDSIDTRSATGQLLMNLITSVSQWERQVIGERTREALAHLKAQGRILGAPRTEDALARRVEALAAQGLNYTAIARRLNAEGLPAPKGGVWRDTTVRKVVRRAA